MMIAYYYILISVYAATMIALIIGYKKVPLFKFINSEEIPSQTKFSVVIPFRNEAENLPALLNSIAKLNFPRTHFELLFIDDASEDHSVQLIEAFFKLHQSLEFSYQIIPNQHTSNSPKKDAIKIAIKNSKNPWIITTDADCVLPSKWLNIFDAYIQKKEPNMVVGPVSYIPKNNLVNTYQQFDNFSLQATTIGSFGLHAPLLSNGANLAYKKEEFTNVNGFEGNDHVASGDDIFLLEKFIKKDHLKVTFLKSLDALVKTEAEKSWSEITKQRIRWASKTSKQNNRASLGLGVLVFIINLMIILLFNLSFLQTFYFFHFTILFALKIIIDGFVMYQHAKTFNLKFSVFSLLLCEILYPFITIIVVLGSLFGTYTWKNRRFKK